MRLTALDGARRRDQRLPDHLSAEHALPAVLRRTPAKKIHFELLDIEHIEHGLDGSGHRQARVEDGSRSDALQRNKGQGARAGKADLEAVGFTVTTQSAPWNPDYLAANQAGTQQAYLLGWTGDFGDPDNFIGTFFQTEQAQWGFDEPDIFDALDAAEAETDLETRTQMYMDINAMIAEFVPGVPYVHTQPSIAFKAGISGYEPSPVNNEDFATVTISE